MRLVMVDADERFAQGERDGLRRLESDHQRDRQTRPLRGGDGVKLSGVYTRFAQRGLHDGHQVPQMFARGQFRHHPAVLGMQPDLRGNDTGQNPAVAHDRRAGFIAGSFNGEKVMIVSEFSIPRQPLEIQCPAFRLKLSRFPH